jgi:hypothetical protein
MSITAAEAKIEPSIVVLPAMVGSIIGFIFVGGICVVMLLAFLNPASAPAALPMGMLFFLAFGYFALSFLFGAIGLEAATSVALSPLGLTGRFMFFAASATWEEIAGFTIKSDGEGGYFIVVLSDDGRRLMKIYDNIFWNSSSDEAHSTKMLTWLNDIRKAEKGDRCRLILAPPDFLRVATK